MHSRLPKAQPRVAARLPPVPACFNCGGSSACSVALAGAAGVAAVAGTTGGAGGGGGRIAIVYNTTAQSALATPDVSLSTRGAPFGASSGTKPYGDIGSLYFSDNHFLVTNLVHSGVWTVPIAFTNWGPNELTISNGWIRFTADGFHLTLTNRLLVTGTDYLKHQFDMYSNAVVRCGDVVVSGASLRELMALIDRSLLHRTALDRECTRLDSSPPGTSFAVFCLKKNTKDE